MGNVLRGDDGFGIEVARRLQQHPELPPEVSVVEVGIAGVPLVQDLLEGYGLLIIVDAVSKCKPPGTLVMLEPTVPDISGTPWEEVGELLGDPHTTTPSRVLLLAQALGALPEKVVIVGCEPQVVDEMQMTLSPQVAAAVPVAVDQVIALVQDWLKQSSQSSRSELMQQEAVDWEDREDRV